MKKRRIVFSAVAVFVTIVAVFITRLTISYLMDYERADNIITIGKVEVSLDEGDFPENSIVAVGGTLTKAPTVTNTGINDEYVFLSVAVPKKEVTLLYEDTVTGTSPHNEGEKISNAEKVEIFKVIADGALVTNNGNVDIVPDSSDPKKIVFSFHKGSNSVAGWEYLNTFTDSCSEDYDIYYFGYNKKLLAEGNADQKTTNTLFDKIQLKSFIDEELSGSYENATGDGAKVTVIVKAYGIQADELGIDGLPGNDDFLTNEQLGKILTIVKNKQ